MNLYQKTQQRKIYYSILLILFFSSSLMAQNKFSEGYICLKRDEPVLIDIHIPIAGKIQTRKDGKVTIYERTSLKDYGYIKNGEQVSRFAATAFPIKTYPGYYVLSGTKDTIDGYFIKWNQDNIVLYRKSSLKKLKLQPAGIMGFAVKENEAYDWYDKLDFLVKKGTSGLSQSESQFCKAQIRGKMSFYETDYTIDLPLAYAEDIIDIRKKNGKLRAKGNTIPVYIFAKEHRNFAVISGNFRSNKKIIKDLKVVFADYPKLLEKLENEKFKKANIPALVEKYNNHFEIQSK